MDNAKKRNVWLDLFKLFLAFLVVCIHTVRDTYNSMPLYRLAVPVFFMICGYFVFSKDKETQIKKSKKFLIRSIKYLIIAELFYILFGFVRCIFYRQNFAHFFNGLFKENILFNFFITNKPISGWEHLWFLIALVVIGLIHYLLVKFDKTKWYWVLIPTLLLIKMFFIGWVQLARPGHGTAYYMYVRNALFFGLPCFGLGYTMAKFNLNKKSWYKYIYLALGIGFWFMQLLESKLVVMEVYLSTMVSAFFLLEFFLGLKSIKCDWYYKYIGKNASFYIYILHCAVATMIWEYMTPAIDYWYALVVFILSFVVYEIGFWTTKLIKHFIIKHKQKTTNLTKNMIEEKQELL